jgi:hypothetical protein
VFFAKRVSGKCFWILAKVLSSAENSGCSLRALTHFEMGHARVYVPGIQTPIHPGEKCFAHRPIISDPQKIVCFGTVNLLGE